MDDPIDGPRYESLAYSARAPYDERSARLQARGAGWAVYYHGRVLHDGLCYDEVKMVRDWYLSGLPSSDPRWGLLITPGKQPSPSPDHR